MDFATWKGVPRPECLVLDGSYARLELLDPARHGADLLTSARQPGAGGQPAIRFRRPADHRSRAKRWCATIDELIQLRAEYQAWLDTLPQTLQETATAEALRTICDLDLQELQTVEPPRGFGRD